MVSKKGILATDAETGELVQVDALLRRKRKVIIVDDSVRRIIIPK